MIHYLIILAFINMCAMHASEENKHTDANSFDSCAGLLFKSKDIASVSRKWNDEHGTWAYKVELHNTGTATCEHDPSKHCTPGQPVPEELWYTSEYNTCYIKPGFTKPNDGLCTTGSQEQYRLVELVHSEHRKRDPYGAFIEQLEQEKLEKRNQIKLKNKLLKAQRALITLLKTIKV